MDEQGARGNFIFTLIKFILFLIIFCFLAEVTKEFWREVRSAKDLKLTTLVLPVLCAFGFYTFLTDLNEIYKKIQNFFFRSSFFSLVFPSLLILAALGYFFLPKIMKASYDRDVFIFIGGFLFTVHLIFIARETKGHTFSAVIHYLFIFSILYILNLMLFGLYLKIAFKLEIGKVALDGMRNGAILIQNIFTQIRK
jgi:hypothetical protein